MGKYQIRFGLTSVLMYDEAEIDIRDIGGRYNESNIKIRLKNGTSIDPDDIDSIAYISESGQRFVLDKNNLRG